MRISTLMIAAVLPLVVGLPNRATAGDTDPIEITTLPGMSFPARDSLAVGDEPLEDARNCLQALCWSATDFTVSCGQSARSGWGEVLVQFPSPVASGHQLNDQVSMEWYVAYDEHKQPRPARADLRESSHMTVVFAHQRLDVSNHYGVRNAAVVRQVLEQSAKVLAVFQGHSHKNDHNQIVGVHYCTLVAMIEGSGAEQNGYAAMSIDGDGTIRVRGFRKQSGYAWHVKTS